MGRPLSPLERQQISAWLAVNAPTVCARSGRRLTSRERLDALRDAVTRWEIEQRAALEEQRRQRAATPRAPSPELLKWHKIYWECGTSLACLGVMVGRHATTLREAFVKCGLPTRPRRGAQLDQAA